MGKLEYLLLARLESAYLLNLGMYATWGNVRAVL